MIQLGPVDVLAVALGEPRFDERVFAAIEKRLKSGTIRALDVMILFKDETGMPWRLDLGELSPEQMAAVEFIEDESLGVFGEDDEAVFYEGMVPGSGILALVIEHDRAVELVNALVDADYLIALNYRVPEAILDEALASTAVH